jgi:hypothetical protein
LAPSLLHSSTSYFLLSASLHLMRQTHPSQSHRYHCHSLILQCKLTQLTHRTSQLLFFLLQSCSIDQMNLRDFYLLNQQDWSQVALTLSSWIDVSH